MTGRRRAVVAGAVVLVAAAATAVVVARSDSGDDHAGLTVGWGGSEGHPSCIYDSGEGTVDATIAIDGSVSAPETVTVTVTAYADENTSRPVGSGSGSVDVDGTVHTSLVVTMSVARPPHVDEDGVAACSLSRDR